MADIERIETVDRAREILQDDEALVFKHSTRCPVSARAERIFAEFAKECCGDTKICLVDVIRSRDVSSAIAEETGINHQSPQAIIIKNGSVCAHTSHYEITREWMDKELT